MKWTFLGISFVDFGLEEILGYNTTANLDNIAAGAVASYYGVAGCRTFNNLTHRGCMSGVTRQNCFRRNR